MIKKKASQISVEGDQLFEIKYKMNQQFQMETSAFVAEKKGDKILSNI